MIIGYTEINKQLKKNSIEQVHKDEWPHKNWTIQWGLVSSKFNKTCFTNCLFVNGAKIFNS
jgi:hypothetical protein